MFDEDFDYDQDSDIYGEFDDVDELTEQEDFEQTDEYFGYYGEDSHLDGMYEE